MERDGRLRQRAARYLAVCLLAGCLTGIATARPAAAFNVVSSASSGGETVCAVMSDGSGECWGDNTYGQLGNGTTTSSAVPVVVSGGYTWASISTYDDTWAGDNVATTCGVTTTHAGYCWGANTYGNVGDNTTTERTSPTVISGGHSWLSISVGAETTCGIDTSNAAYCWGANAGQIGDGTVTPRHIPTLVSGSHLFASISTGGNNTCGVTTTNSGYCWGANWDGEVGDGTTSTDTSPVLVAGSWLSITEGTEDSCGVTTGNLGYCWGKGASGQIGDTFTTERTSPTAVSGGLSFSYISAGLDEECGLTTGGAGYCWGANGAGQIGDNTTTQRHSPTAVSGGYTFTSITTGQDSVNGTNCGLIANGTLYCWGYNNVSQIGDGTTTNRKVPTEAVELYEITQSVSVSAPVVAAFTFTVGNQSTACNGESNFVSGAGTASTVALGKLNAGANVSGGQALSVTGNSASGFVIYLSGTQATQNLRGGSHNWTDVTGTYGSPAALGAGERFGYTYHDSTTASSVTNPASANFIALTSTKNAVIGSATSESGSGCVSFDAQAGATTPPGSYTATAVFTAVPTF